MQALASSTKTYDQHIYRFLNLYLRSPVTEYCSSCLALDPHIHVRRGEYETLRITGKYPSCEWILCFLYVALWDLMTRTLQSYNFSFVDESDCNSTPNHSFLIIAMQFVRRWECH